MKAQHGFGVRLSWPRATAVFLIDVGILIGASQLRYELWPGRTPSESSLANYAWWSAVAVALLVAIATLVTYRRIPLTSALTSRVRDRRTDPASILAAQRVHTVDHQRRCARQTVGIREYRGQLVAVIAVSAAAAHPGRHHRASAPPISLAVKRVAAGLRQFDVRLDGIDIVSVRTRDGAAGTDGIPSQPPSGHRSTWLVPRMNPERNVAAVAARDSVASTFAAAVERIANDLDGPIIAARVVSAEEFADVDAAVLAGLHPTQLRRRRRWLKQKLPRQTKRVATSFWVSPRDITSETLGRLWLPDTETTAVTVRLTYRPGRTEVSTLVRFHAAGRLRRNVHAGLNRLTGQQLTALHASLPIPTQRTLVVPVRELDDREALEVSIEPAVRRLATPIQAPMRSGAAISAPRIPGDRAMAARSPRHRLTAGGSVEAT